MNIRDLQYLIAVAEYKHFGIAAEKSFVSQPALSAQIKKLEQELGVLLFERNNRQVMLTDIGEDIVVSARKILREVNDMKNIAQQAHDPLSGQFRIGAFPTLASYIFPNLVTNAKEILPDLRLILIEEKTSSLVDMLKKGDIDAALLSPPITEDSFTYQELFKDNFYVAVPQTHELASHQNISEAQLSNYPLLLLEEGHCLRAQCVNLCQIHNIDEQQDFKATSMETLRQMIRAGIGISIFPEIAISNDVHKQDKDMKYIPFAHNPPSRSIALAWRKTTKRNEVMDHLINILSR